MLARERSAQAAQDKALDKKRLDLESAFARREKDLDKKYAELSEKLYAQYQAERSVWEARKLEVLNADRQALRADFEKKEALLHEKFDEELAKHRADRVRREEEFSARKDELEKAYYAELERSRGSLDKLRAKLEADLAVKFRELEEEKNRLSEKRTQGGGD